MHVHGKQYVLMHLNLVLQDIVQEVIYSYIDVTFLIVFFLFF